MNKDVTKIIFFFLFFSISSLCSLASVKVKVRNCEGDKEYPHKYTAGRLINGLNRAAKYAPNCLPPGLANSVKYNALSLEITIRICLDIEECAEANIINHSIKVGYKTLLGNCGCIESIMLHELLHLGGLGSTPEEELKAESCELKCFPDCAVVSSNASKDKCCDEKK